MFSRSVSKDCFATRVKVACKTVSTSAPATGAAVTRSCRRSELAAHGHLADQLPTRRAPLQFGLVRLFAPSGACDHPRLQEFRLWEGPNPSERANQYGLCRASCARSAHESACESGACGTPGSSPAA